MKRKTRKKIEKIKYYARINAEIEEALLSGAFCAAAMCIGFFYATGDDDLFFISIMACIAFKVLQCFVQHHYGNDKLDGFPIPRRRFTISLFDRTGYRLRDNTHAGEAIVYLGRLEDYLQARGVIDDR